MNLTNTVMDLATVTIKGLTAKVKELKAKVATLEASLQSSTSVESMKDEILSLHRQLAAERLRADQGWQRYEAANADRNSLRAEMVASTLVRHSADQPLNEDNK